MNPAHQGRGIATLIIGILLGLISISLMILIGLQLGDRSDKIVRAAEIQKEVGAQRRALLYEAGKFYCREIEKLKSAERADARRVYRELPDTLKLLHLKPTPELRAAALRNRNRKLDRYAYTPCPITAAGLGISPKK